MKSARFWVLMVLGDEEALDERLDCAALAATWESRGPGPWTPTHHGRLIEALNAGSGHQALLRLVGSTGPTGPVLQYLRGSAFDQEPSTECLRAGSVAYKWSPATTDASLGAAFQRLVDAACAAIRSVTLPHVVDHDGRPARRIRIGREASRWYLEAPWPRRRLCDMSTAATYRLRTEAGMRLERR